MSRLFGSDGIKGIANTELTAEIAFKIGFSAALVLIAKTDTAPKILVGRDTRISGHMLESALVAGICSAGANAECVGIVPAPAIAYLARKYKMDAGVSISASHRSMEYNGIKIFDSDGFKISSEMEDRIEAYASGSLRFPEPKIGGELGKISRSTTAMRDYVDLVKETVGADLSGMKVAIDCANGAAYQCAKLCFKELGADVDILNNVPNGKNINDNCGSAHIETLAAYVAKNKCSFGLAMDGDGDHLRACDENGAIIPDEMLAALCSDMLNDDSKANDGLVSAVCLASLYKEKGLPMSELIKI